MGVTAIVGGNWGDEGKGKMTDHLAARADFVVRFQGGNNAGHTIINERGKFALHLLPGGVFHDHVTNVLGPGVAVNVRALLGELAALQAAGVRPRLLVSDRAQVVLDVHRLQDVYEEVRLGEHRFGSTQQGIAPFYADKYIKTGIQVADLCEPRRLKERVERLLAVKNVFFEALYGKPAADPEALCADLAEQGELLAPYVADVGPVLHDAVAAGREILLEGQLGALRDPDHGIYPFVTSSSPLAGFAAVGAGVPPWAITRIIAVVKAYSTCVGAGPFTTELQGEEAETLRARGGDSGEYGATTGRPRRVGWFDAVATRYGCRVQGATEVALTCLDVLGYLDEVPICTHYRIDGELTAEFPVPARLERAEPVYERLPGWRKDIRGVRTFEELPPEAKAYVARVEEVIGVPVRWISTGPQREAVIERK